MSQDENNDDNTAPCAYCNQDPCFLDQIFNEGSENPEDTLFNNLMAMPFSSNSVESQALSASSNSESSSDSDSMVVVRRVDRCCVDPPVSVDAVLFSAAVIRSARLACRTCNGGVPTNSPVEF
mmetsp:Transcript_89537/g.175248  ORF Transcript_89537/g.175248 Transcript_89537/m.175248 type:complete len:123 (+) Transcript_89537:337-705(+)